MPVPYLLTRPPSDGLGGAPAPAPAWPFRGGARLVGGSRTSGSEADGGFARRSARPQARLGAATDGCWKTFGSTNHLTRDARVASSKLALMADSGNAEPLRCSFCDRSQKQVNKLIAGPSVYICDRCVDLSTQLIQGAIVQKDVPEASALKLEERPTSQVIRTTLETGGFSDLEAQIIRLAAKGTNRYKILNELDLWDEQKFVYETVRRVFRQCSFCGKDQMHIEALIAGPSVFICDECLDLCTEIIIEVAEEGDGEGPEPPLPPPREPPEPSTREEIRRASLPPLTDRENES